MANVLGTISWSETGRFQATGDWTLKQTVQAQPVPTLSGIILNQNTRPPDDSSYLNIGADWYFQEFYLPNDYIRGLGTEARVPNLTGVQVCVAVTEGSESAASLSWQLDTYIIGTGWLSLGRGTSIGAQASGEKVWFDVYFSPPVDITPYWQNLFRLGVQARSRTGIIHEPVHYDGEFAVVDGEAYRVALVNDTPFNFLTNDGVPSILYFDTATQTTYYSVQQGITKFWYTVPNPHSKFAELYKYDGTVVEVGSVKASLLYRILGATADSGIDILGNPYRQIVVKNTAANLAVNTGTNFWLSKPNPSQDGVECLYFNISDLGGGTQVIDKIYIDPLTPNILCNVYWSTEGPPASNRDDWDNKVWNPADTFFLRKTDTHALPRPVTANYIKLEFSQLQARPYEPYNQYKPIVYSKFPQWVQTIQEAANPPLPQTQQATHDPFVPPTVAHDQNLLDLGYRFRIDLEGLFSRVRFPTLKLKEQLTFGRLGFPVQRSKRELDVSTLLNINTELNPWTFEPPGRSKLNKLLSGLTLSKIFQRFVYRPVQLPTYPVEAVPQTPVADTTQTSSVQRDQTLEDQTPKAPSFQISARHSYQEVSAVLPTKKAYFAGIKEVAFTREHYSAAYDGELYTELAGDDVNLERNDFESVDMTWVVYDEANTTT